eukprot:Pgem_evm1s16941
MNLLTKRSSTLLSKVKCARCCQQQQQQQNHQQLPLQWQQKQLISFYNYQTAKYNKLDLLFHFNKNKSFLLTRTYRTHMNTHQQANFANENESQHSKEKFDPIGYAK